MVLAASYFTLKNKTKNDSTVFENLLKLMARIYQRKLFEELLSTFAVEYQCIL